MSEKITAAIEVTVEVHGNSGCCGFDCKFRNIKKEYCILFDKNLDAGRFWVYRCPECIATFPPAGAGEKYETD